MQTDRGNMKALGVTIPYIWNQKNPDNKKLVIVIPSKDYSTQAPLLFYTYRVYWEEGFDVIQFRYTFQDIDEELLPRALNEMIVNFLRKHAYDSIQFVSIGLGSTAVAYFLRNQIYPNVKAVWFSPYLHEEKVLNTLIGRENIGLVILGDDREVLLENEVQLLEEKDHLIVGYVNGNENLDSYWVEISLDILKSITKMIQQFIQNEKIELNEEKSQVMVYFTLYGDDFPLEEVTEKIGIMPTRTCKKGDEFIPSNGKVIDAPKRYHPETSWELDSGYVDSIDVEKLFDQLIGQLRSNVFVINELRDKYSLKSHIQVVTQLKNGNSPILTVNKKLINFAHFIQSDYIDYDMYIYPFDDAIQFNRDGVYFNRKL